MGHKKSKQEYKRDILFTRHAITRIVQRLGKNISKEELVKDIRNGFTSIRMKLDGTYSVKSSRGFIYIMSKQEKTFTVITIYNNEV